MKKIHIFIIIIVFSIIFSLIIFTKLKNNETFYQNIYIGNQNQEIFIPKYSYFVEECCMTSATFYSLKSERKLQEEIDNYLSEFTYFDDDYTYGYKKDNLFIQSYEIKNMGLYRKIIIVY